MRNFVKIKSSGNGVFTLSFIDIGQSCLSREIFCVTNMSVNAICGNKILGNVSEFTVTNNELDKGFRKIMIGYDMDIMHQSEYLV